MCTVWHADKYKITVSYQFQENLSQPSIIDARARRLRNTGLYHIA